MLNYLLDMTGGLSPGVRRFIATESLFGIGGGILALILNLHLLQLGLNENEIGQVTSFGALAAGLLSLPAGLMIRRVGRKPMLVAGMIILAVSLAGFGLAVSHAAVLVCQLGWAVGMTAVVTSEIQLIFEYCREKREETRAYSLLFAVFTLFSGIGTLLGGYLPKWIGGMTTEYQYSFFAAAGCLALGALLRAVLLPPSGTTNGKEHTRASEPKVIPKARKSGLWKWNRDSGILCLVIFLSGLLFGLVNPFYNVILKERFGWHDGAISWLLSVSGLFLFAGSLFVPYLLERAGIRKTFALLFAGNAALAFLLALAVPAPVFSVLLLVRGGIFSMLNNLLDSESMSAMPEQDRNRFAGMRNIARSGGNALAAYATGWMLASSGYRLPFLLTGLLLAAGYVIYLVYAQPILERKNDYFHT